jgi:hypothetical protein
MPIKRTGLGPVAMRLCYLSCGAKWNWRGRKAQRTKGPLGRLGHDEGPRVAANTNAFPNSATRYQRDLHRKTDILGRNCSGPSKRPGPRAGAKATAFPQRLRTCHQPQDERQQNGDCGYIQAPACIRPCTSPASCSHLLTPRASNHLLHPPSRSRLSG